MSPEPPDSQPVDSERAAPDSNHKVSMAHHTLFGILGLIVLFVGMELVFLVQQHRVNTLSGEVNNDQSTLVKDSKVSLNNVEALAALPNVVVDNAGSPADLIAFLGANNTQCYESGGETGYFKVIAQANDQFAKMQYGCTAKGGATPLGSTPSYILAKKTHNAWSLISPSNQWLPVNGQAVPSCIMVNDNKVSKLVTPECWQGAALNPGGSTSAKRTVVPVTNP